MSVSFLLWPQPVLLMRIRLIDTRGNFVPNRTLTRSSAFSSVKEHVGTKHFRMNQVVNSTSLCSHVKTSVAQLVELVAN